MNKNIEAVVSPVPIDAKGARVRLEKMETVNNQDGLALETGYFVEGNLCGKVEIGNPVFLDRYMRNNVFVAGLFNTSAIKEIKGNLLYTQNSVWKITYLNPNNS